MKTIKDMLSASELEKYNSLEYPKNLFILHTALKAKLKEDPEYEVFVPLVYYKYIILGKNRREDGLVQVKEWLISNKGRVFSTKRKNHKFLSPGYTNGYYLLIYRNKGEDDTISLHRAIACNFISLPKHLKDFHPKFLHVNHENGIKSDFSFDNLVWSTATENQEHAVLHGLIKTGIRSTSTKSVKGTIVKGKFSGYSFVLHGVTDHRKYGFEQRNISACCLGRVRTHKFCSWAFATPEEVDKLPHGLEPEILSSITI